MGYFWLYVCCLVVLLVNLRFSLLEPFFSGGCETLLPFVPTTPEPIADCGRGPDLHCTF